jgi:DNA polymerase-4
VEKVCSIDEMRVRLLESEATEEAARAIAMKVKGAIAEQIGECLTCSIGLAPNAFLSKVASDMQKPNGLTLLHPETMAEQMARLDLIDFCGLNKRMVVRLNLKGIYSAADLLSASEAQMRSAFGSVVGARWWYLLRGYDLPEEDRPRKSLSNSHVLPPELRTRDLAYGVLLRLLQKATARLRRENLSCRKASFFVRGRSGKWEHKLRAEPTHETLFLVERLQEAWHACEVEDPYQVGLALGDLVRTEERTPSMFDKDNDRHRLAQAVDGLNAKFGKNSILPAGALRSKDAAEERIAFQKTSLFDEGKPS